MIPLTEGAINDIMKGVEVDKPIVQVLGNRKMSSSGSPRYRLLISDGQTINSYTLLAAQLNGMVDDGELTEMSIIQITRYAMSTSNSGGGKPKRIIIILELEVKVPGSEVGGKIGNPVSDKTGADTAPAPSNGPEKVAQKAPNKPAANNRLNASINAGTDITTTPIAALSPYQNRWVIKARISNKSDIRTWNNSRGEGKLFSMDLVDESGEIRCTAFKEQVDKFYDMLEIQKIYYISRAVVKLANKTFNNLKNDYEMTLNNDSEIIPCHDDDNDIPLINYEFKPISQIENIEKGEIVDVLAIVKSCEEVQQLTSKAGRELRKRDISLVDESNTMVTLTLWGTQADNFDGSNNPVIAIKGARIGEFNNGKNLSSLNSSVIQLDPDLAEAHKLRGWFTTSGQTEEARSLSKVGGYGSTMNGQWMMLDEAAARGTQLHDSAETFICKATVNILRHENALYNACPTEGCNKKLLDVGGMYRCEKCNREFPNYKSRLLAHLAVSDSTGTMWATAFNEDAEKMIGMSAQELGELNETNHDEFVAKFTDIAFQSFTFKIRMKMGTYNDQARLNTAIVGVSPVVFKDYNTHLLNEIKKLANAGS